MFFFNKKVHLLVSELYYLICFLKFAWKIVRGEFKK